MSSVKRTKHAVYDTKYHLEGDHTISYMGRKYKILSTQTRFGFAKAKVEVHKHLDGSIHIFYKGEDLKHELVPEQEKRYVSFGRSETFHFSKKDMALPVGV